LSVCEWLWKRGTKLPLGGSNDGFDPSSAGVARLTGGILSSKQCHCHEFHLSTIERKEWQKIHNLTISKSYCGFCYACSRNQNNFSWQWISINFLLLRKANWFWSLWQQSTRCSGKFYPNIFCSNSTFLLKDKWINGPPQTINSGSCASNWLVMTPDGIQVCISLHGIMFIHSENLLREVKHDDKLMLRVDQGNDSNLIFDSFVEQPGYSIASGRKIFITSKIHVRAVELQSFVMKIYFRSFII
jgi:hypothetical protein